MGRRRGLGVAAREVCERLLVGGQVFLSELGDELDGLVEHVLILLRVGHLQDDLLDAHARHLVFRRERVVLPAQVFVGDLELLADLLLVDEDVTNLLLREVEAVIGLVRVEELPQVFVRGVNLLRQRGGLDGDVSKVERGVLADEVLPDLFGGDLPAPRHVCAQLRGRERVAHALLVLRHAAVVALDVILVALEVEARARSRVGELLLDHVAHLLVRGREAEPSGFEQRDAGVDGLVEDAFGRHAELREADLAAELAVLRLYLLPQHRVVGDRHILTAHLGERLLAVRRIGDGRAAAAVVAGDDEAEDDEDGKRDDDDAARLLQPAEKLEHRDTFPYFTRLEFSSGAWNFRAFLPDFGRAGSLKDDRHTPPANRELYRTHAARRKRARVDGRQ